MPDIMTHSQIKKILLRLVLFYLAQTSFANAGDIAQHSASLYGPVGQVKTPSAFSLKQGQGAIGIWEDFRDLRWDNFYFLYGVRNWLEIGVMSDLPAQNNFNFLFKINSETQDRLFKGFPVIALGIYRSNSYLAASYKIRPISLTVGSKLSGTPKPLFIGANVQFSKYLLMQLDTDGKEYGIGIRGQLDKFQFSLLLDGKTSRSVLDNKVYWGVAFNF
ncbi:MAG: hypothetical protein OEZ43_02335 [Gammaproteobacteria bacterium]|nr:hypothetical protein [Gammaproteobacteria bacterium]